jgi:hypothetical protein
VGESYLTVVKLTVVKFVPVNVPAVVTVPCTRYGDPNNANAFVPEPADVIATELVVPVVFDVIFKFPSSTVTVAPVIVI